MLSSMWMEEGKFEMDFIEQTNMEFVDKMVRASNHDWLITMLKFALDDEDEENWMGLLGVVNEMVLRDNVKLLRFSVLRAIAAISDVAPVAPMEDITISKLEN